MIRQEVEPHPDYSQLGPEGRVSVKLAVFDIDNTLRGGYTLKDFAKLLRDRDRFEENAFRAIEAIEEQYKNTDYTKFAQGWVFHFVKGIHRQPVNAVAEVADDFARYHHNLFPFSRELVKFVTDSGYIPIAISGSPYEPIKALCDSLGIKEIFATRILARNGVFLSEGVLTTYITDGSKEAAYEWACYNLKLQRDDVDLDINHKRSLGFGDSEHDTSFLKRVGYPVAVIPSPTLRQFAERRKWLIIVSPESNVVQVVREYLDRPLDPFDFAQDQP